MHSVGEVDGEEIKKARAVNENVVKNTTDKELVGVLFN